MTSRAQSLINRTIGFWFGGIKGNEPIKQDFMKLWFSGSKEVDAAISQQFASSLNELAGASSDLLTELKATPDGVLTAIIHFDQFPRNIYRSSPKAFDFDSHALQLARYAISSKLDLKLHPVKRMFVYLPLEHSESLQDQQECVRQYQQLCTEYGSTSQYGAILEAFLKYGNDHLVIIERFGRFPHRNRILGRQSTAEEEAYLVDGATFGQ